MVGSTGLALTDVGLGECNGFANLAKPGAVPLRLLLPPEALRGGTAPEADATTTSHDRPGSGGRAGAEREAGGFGAASSTAPAAAEEAAASTRHPVSSRDPLSGVMASEVELLQVMAAPSLRLFGGSSSIDSYPRLSPLAHAAAGAALLRTDVTAPPGNPAGT